MALPDYSNSIGLLITRRWPPSGEEFHVAWVTVLDHVVDYPPMAGGWEYRLSLIIGSQASAEAIQNGGSVSLSALTTSR